MLYVGTQTALKCHLEESAKGQIGRLSGSKKKKSIAGCIRCIFLNVHWNSKEVCVIEVACLLYFQKSKVWLWNWLQGISISTEPWKSVCWIKGMMKSSGQMWHWLAVCRHPWLWALWLTVEKKCTPRGFLWPRVLHPLPRTRKWADRHMTNWMKASSILIFLIFKGIWMKNVLHKAFPGQKQAVKQLLVERSCCRSTIPIL